MSLPSITGTARLTDDPELRFTASGKAVAKLRLAFSERKKDDSGNWVDGDNAFLDASVWGDEAEHVAESLQRGMEVLVSGKLRQREYEAKDGTKRTVFELMFVTVAPTLKFATAKVQKMQRSGGQQGQAPRAQQGGNFDDPWSTQGAQPPRGSREQSSSFDEAPPF
jgi:single-strand DNA-binding protein